MLSINEEETYQEALSRHVAAGASREDVVAFMQKHNNNVIDFDSLPDQKHNWHDQGEKLSCWDAGHPMHQVWKPRKNKRL